MKHITKQNISINTNESDSKIDVLQIDWFMFQHEVVVSQMFSNITPDIIVAADCTYSCDLHYPLIRVISTLLNHRCSSKQRQLQILGFRIPLPCAIVVSTIRNLDTHNHFIACLMEMSHTIEYLDVTSLGNEIDINSELFHDLNDQMNVACIYQKSLPNSLP